MILATLRKFSSRVMYSSAQLRDFIQNLPINEVEYCHVINVAIYGIWTVDRIYWTL
jgi:hypothetical protein